MDTTMRKIHALTGLALEGEAGALVAELVAMLAEGLPRRGGICMEGPDRAGAIYIPDVSAMTDTRGPAQRRLEALTGWAMTEREDNAGRLWVGPDFSRRWASVDKLNGSKGVSIWPGGGDRAAEKWLHRPVDGDPIEAACAELLRRHDEGIDPLPALVLEPAAPPTFDPRIGQWCVDHDGSERGLVVARVASSEWPLQALNCAGNPICLSDYAIVTDPPDPIPAPCRPVWEAFRALEGAS